MLAVVREPEIDDVVFRTGKQEITLLGDGPRKRALSPSEHVRQQDTFCPVSAVYFIKPGLLFTRQGRPTPLERTVSYASTILMKAISRHAATEKQNSQLELLSDVRCSRSECFGRWSGFSSQQLT